ncbi:MAG: hypothetical protein HFE79_00365 [Ruminiclostridium sp.]|nr:hypothetical protein [Ruminiclostridium sp.]
MIFFLVPAVISFVALAAEMILRSAYKIKNFGAERYFFDFHGKTVPFEDFVPHTVSDILIFVLAFSALGLILSAVSMPVAGSVFCGIVFAFIVMYLKKHFFFNLFLKARGEKLPKNRPDVDDKAVCAEAITNGGYGKIEFFYKGRGYMLTAMSANETDIEAGKEVTVVHKEKGICWVEKVEEELEETD